MTALELAAPDISPYEAGNTGIPYVTSFESGRPGPHVLVNALTHGMCIGMLKVLGEWAQDTTVKAVAICGAGTRAFCAGVSAPSVTSFIKPPSRFISSGVTAPR